MELEINFLCKKCAAHVPNCNKLIHELRCKGSSWNLQSDLDPQSNISPYKWRCSRCTFRNSETQTECTMCESPMIVERADSTTNESSNETLHNNNRSSLSSLGIIHRGNVDERKQNDNPTLSNREYVWFCATCSYRNNTRSSICEMCNTAHPTDSTSPNRDVDASDINETRPFIPRRQVAPIRNKLPPIIQPPISRTIIHRIQNSTPTERFVQNSSTQEDESEISLALLEIQQEIFGIDSQLQQQLEMNVNHNSDPDVQSNRTARPRSRQQYHFMPALRRSPDRRSMTFYNGNNDGSDVDGMGYDELLTRFGGREQKKATPSSIASLPTRTYQTRKQTQTQTTADHRSEQQEGDSCGVCLEDFESGEELKTLPCLHCFHRGCLDKWLATSGTCPICKVKL